MASFEKSIGTYVKFVVDTETYIRTPRITQSNSSLNTFRNIKRTP